ncbi:hypothetical protein T484DRAFT_1857452 [Baffinella frigidus]|nr:hypothetical protein T484DRAFT_1857452 [Cryptophyta sp. CCMP2293]
MHCTGRYWDWADAGMAMGTEGGGGLRVVGRGGAAAGGMQRFALSMLALPLLAAPVMAQTAVDPAAPVVREYFNPASCFIGFREVPC